MIASVNHFLLPAEKIIRHYQKYIGYFCIALSFGVLPVVFFPEYMKSAGEYAKNLLLFILFLPIFSKVIGLKIAQILMPLRKEMGILMGSLAFVHGASFNIQYPSFMLEGIYWWQNGMVTHLGVGFFALLLTIPLVLTSNVWAMKKLGKHWKKLHRLAYWILVLVMLHVMLIAWTQEAEFEIGPILILIAYF